MNLIFGLAAIYTALWLFDWVGALIGFWTLVLIIMLVLQFLSFILRRLPCLT